MMPWSRLWFTTRYCCPCSTPRSHAPDEAHPTDRQAPITASRHLLKQLAKGRRRDDNCGCQWRQCVCVYQRQKTHRNLALAASRREINQAITANARLLLNARPKERDHMKCWRQRSCCCCSERRGHIVWQEICMTCDESSRARRAKNKNGTW